MIYFQKFICFFGVAAAFWGCVTQNGIRLTSEEFDRFSDKEFQVEKYIIHMNGYIDEKTPELLRQILRGNPQFTTVVMHDVPGSLDDEACLEAARLVRRFKLNTHLPADAEIVSGAVDFYLAGVKRTAVVGAKVGVHSWRDDQGIEGTDVPKDHKGHRLFLDFYRDIGVSEEFYWFTVEAAPFEKIYWMNRRELEHYKVFTKPMLDASN